MHIDDFDYNLPEDRIAQHPADRRDNARLMVIHRDTGAIRHRRFYDIVEYLNPGDCLVLNDSKVLPARLSGRKESTGAGIEVLLLKRISGDVWEAMIRPGKRLKKGDTVRFAPDFFAEAGDPGPDGTRAVTFFYDGIFQERLEALGSMPLPPYIRRPDGPEAADRERYQTVYCREEGSVAAPTAGLHFTRELLEEAGRKGVHTACVTLHVGIGTFRPVKCSRVEDHVMHFEEYQISREAADRINRTRSAGGRIIAVGTTSTRTLESAPRGERKDPEGAGGSSGIILPGAGATNAFIYPGHTFQATDALITNFHLPKSTLLMLVSAFYSREGILAAYETAIAEGYRFFSYGDAMLIL